MKALFVYVALHCFLKDATKYPHEHTHSTSNGISGRHLHSSCSFRHIVSQLLAVASFLLQPQLSGTHLHLHVQSSPSIATFPQRLKTFLFVSTVISDIII